MAHVISLISRILSRRHTNKEINGKVVKISDRLLQRKLPIKELFTVYIVRADYRFSSSTYIYQFRTKNNWVKKGVDMNDIKSDCNGENGPLLSLGSAIVIYHSKTYFICHSKNFYLLFRNTFYLIFKHILVSRIKYT